MKQWRQLTIVNLPSSPGDYQEYLENAERPPIHLPRVYIPGRSHSHVAWRLTEFPTDLLRF
jgi:hypothetical protein